MAAFDLGAQGERLRAYPKGYLLPNALATDPAACNDWLLSVIKIARSARLPVSIQAAEYDQQVHNYYGEAPFGRLNQPSDQR